MKAIDGALDFFFIQEGKPQYMKLNHTLAHFRLGIRVSPATLYTIPYDQQTS